MGRHGKRILGRVVRLGTGSEAPTIWLSARGKAWGRYWSRGHLAWHDVESADGVDKAEWGWFSEHEAEAFRAWLRGEAPPASNPFADLVIEALALHRGDPACEVRVYLHREYDDYYVSRLSDCITLRWTGSRWVWVKAPKGDCCGVFRAGVRVEWWDEAAPSAVREKAREMSLGVAP